MFNDTIVGMKGGKKALGFIKEHTKIFYSNSMLTFLSGYFPCLVPAFQSKVQECIIVVVDHMLTNAISGSFSKISF